MGCGCEGIVLINGYDGNPPVVEMLASVEWSTKEKVGGVMIFDVGRVRETQVCFREKYNVCPLLEGDSLYREPSR